MCCFTRQVTSVSATRIFARSLPDPLPQWQAAASATAPAAPSVADPRRQLIVYQMAASATEAVAMVLPLPVVPDGQDTAMRFIDLQAAPRWFSALDDLWPRPASRGRSADLPAPQPEGMLAVHTVGAFIASYVPRPSDFARLDPRFRLDEALLTAEPRWRDWGFAVFQFQPGRIEPHPMAFTFQRRDPRRLFLPTVHIHDGTRPATAGFDHVLYIQRTERDAWPSRTTGINPAAPRRSYDWDESPGLVNLRDERQAGAPGLLLPDQHVLRLNLHGRFVNQDIELAA